MKKQYALLAILMFGTIGASSANETTALSSCLQNATDSELLAEVRSRMNGGGTPPEERVRIDSKVDAACLDQMKSSYPYQPDKNKIITWAGSCRTQIDTSRCTQLSSSSDNSCFQKLISFYPYQPDSRVIEDFTNACKAITYYCTI